MINKKVFSESYAILLALGEDYISRIPEDVLEFVKSKMDLDYLPQIDENKEFKDQPILKETFAMIAWLRLKYWCKSEEERAEFLEYLEISEEDLMISTRELMKLLGEGHE